MPPKHHGGRWENRNWILNNYPLRLTDYNGVVDLMAKAHELGHLFFGFLDEYEDEDDNLVLDWKNFGLMDCDRPWCQERASELSRTSVDYDDEFEQVTAHWDKYEKGCSDHFRSEYSGYYGSYPGVFVLFKSPEDYSISGHLTGPNNWDDALDVWDMTYDVGSMMTVDIDDHMTDATEFLMGIRPPECEDGDPPAVWRIAVSLLKPVIPGNFYRKLDLGATDDDGWIRIMGTMRRMKFAPTRSVHAPFGERLVL